MTFAIGIGTFGSDEWDLRGRKLAKSISADFPILVMHSHGDSLQGARNSIIEVCKTEYLIFLDADDDLQFDYLEAMANGTADVLVPKVRYIHETYRSAPHFPRVVGCSHDGPCCAACLPLGNYAVVGSAACTDALRAVGGFRDWPMYEDWDLWLRMHLAGYTFENVEGAV